MGTTAQLNSRLDDSTGNHEGFTLIEMAMTVVLLGILASLAAYALGNFVPRERVRREASGLADRLAELRSLSVRGLTQPCLHFPGGDVYAAFSDKNRTGTYESGSDSLLWTHTLHQTASIASLNGGTGAEHSVCYGDKGVSSSGSLEVVFSETGGAFERRLSLLAATGKARVQ